MKFKKLRLVGFKSFAEPSEFLFENGLTGVVGPNGCGKSNLVEALRWVMGESSYKSLRATGMEDVIFSGSNNRPSRNTAEITLFLEKGDLQVSPEFNDSDDLEVTRRIERESGSSYRINGRDVRARDVQILFADASTGFRSTALVQQGQVSELINAKPTARRQLLEEAAGITGLHTRRHEAELRLKGAETNLERLEDVLTQLTNQLDSLKKQSRQANRYRNISSDIRKAEASILFLRWNENHELLSEIGRNLVEIESKAKSVSEKHSEHEKAQSKASERLPELRDNSSKAGEQLQRSRNALEEIDSEEKRIRDRCGELNSRIEQLKQDIGREEGLVRDNAVRLGELEKEGKELTNQDAGFAKRHKSLADSVNSSREVLRTCESKLEAVTAEQAGNIAQMAELEKAKEEGTRRIIRLEEHVAAISKELDGISKEIDSDMNPDSFRKEVEKAQVLLEKEKSKEQSCETAAAEARKAESSARETLAEAERQFSALESETRTLDDVLGTYSEKKGVPILDSINVEPGLETALGAALGEDLDASVDNSFLVHWSNPIDGSDDPNLPDGVKPLSSTVEAPAELRRRLSQIGLVERKNGEAVQQQLKSGQRLVSVEGDLWRWDGFVVGADAKTPAAKRLEQRNRLGELKKQLVDSSSRVQKLKNDLKKCQQKSASCVKEEQEARQNVREYQKNLEIRQRDYSEIEQRVGRLSASQKAQVEARNRAESELKEAKQALDAVLNSLKKAESAKDLTPELEKLKSEVETLRGELAQKQAQLESVERENQLKQDRLASIERECESWREREKSAKDHIANLRERQGEAENELRELDMRPDEFEKRRSELKNEVEKREEAFTKAQEELKLGEQAQEEAGKAERAAKENLAEVRESLVRIEERKQSVLTRSEDIEKQIRESLGCKPDELREIAGIKDGKALPNADESERRLERLKSERERLGGVNLRAETEMSELSEQKETLVTERDDLIEAIRKLRQGIASLNKEARSRLLEAFDQVNQEFQRLFTHLFSGGTAKLELIDSEDPLQAGLEILARPPGKKPQSMTLLSGGEQALTCIALIFAVFMTNPAPICVLDEVDAPLDDTNVERYCGLLDEMAAPNKTRFIVITHNPITMSRMNRLYGVTMAERGVSQLVSVDLRTAEQFSEAS